ncbi:hypothetical protein [Kosakonia sacchari]|uniref:hypothetical protein n=1 Tax=Kosakonia sacchari TaxID=1158459 RepID=UPI003F57336B
MDISYIFLETLKSVLPIISTLIFIVVFFMTSPGRIFIKSFKNTFLDKGISTDFSDEEKTSSIISKLIKDEVTKRFNNFTEDDKEYIEVAKSKLNSALEAELKTLLMDNDDSHKLRELVASKIEKETLVISENVLNNSEVYEKINNKYKFRSKEENKKELLLHIEEEYRSARRTKQLMSNLFIMINFFYFSALLLLALLSFSNFALTRPDNIISSKLILAVSFAYLGFGSFVIYMIKFCNSRTLTLLTLREEASKKEDIIDITKKIIEGDINENHVAIMKILNTNYSSREQATKHPYELLFNGVKDSNIVFKAGKFELSKEQKQKG